MSLINQFINFIKKNIFVIIVVVVILVYLAQIIFPNIEEGEGLEERKHIRRTLKNPFK